MFNILPVEILKCELLPLLDDGSLLCLQVALYVKVYPYSIPLDTQDVIVSHGLTLTRYFNDQGLLNHENIGVYAAFHNQQVQIIKIYNMLYL